MLKKILVAVDESASSDWAFATALELAAGLNAELLIVHALDIFAPASPQHPSIPTSGSMVEIDEAAYEDYQQKWTKHVEHYDALLRQKQSEAEVSGVSCEYVQPHGHPGPAICQAATENNADLIVIGNRDQTTLIELVLGSVSNYVLHHAPCSVTVVHSANCREAVADNDAKEESKLEHAAFASTGAI